MLVVKINSLSVSPDPVKIGSQTTVTAEGSPTAFIALMVFGPDGLPRSEGELLLDASGRSKQLFTVGGGTPGVWRISEVARPTLQQARQVLEMRDFSDPSAVTVTFTVIQ